MEYTVIEHEGKDLKIYNTIKPQRVEEETQEEYKIRRKAIKNYLKNKEKVIHRSAMLIPKMNDDGEIEFDSQGKPTYIGKTKGVSYKKENKKEEHLTLVDKLEELKGYEK